MSKTLIRQCIQCEKYVEGDIWKNGECCVAGMIFACCRACAETWCKSEDIPFSEIEEHNEGDESE